MAIDDIICQVGVVTFGCAAIWFVSRKERWSRWGYILGLFSQPVWFYTFGKHKQWGMLLLSVWYLYSWSQGVWNYWIQPWRKSR